MIRCFIEDRKGTTAIEYALIAILISVAVIGGMRAVGGDVDSLYASSSEKVSEAINGTD